MNKILKTLRFPVDKKAAIEELEESFDLADGISLIFPSIILLFYYGLIDNFCGN